MNEENSKIIEKIKNLLRKAADKRGNVYECELAMAMAQKLMIKHKISQAVINAAAGKDEKIYATEREYKTNKSASEMPYIGTILKRYFDCEWFHCLKSDGSRRITIISTPENIDFAVYVYEFLETQMRYALKLARRKSDSYVSRSSFYKGFFHGIISTLEKAKEEERAAAKSEDRACYDLVCVKTSEALAAHLKQHCPLVRETDTRARTIDGAAYAAGVSAGQKTKIARPIDG